MVLVALQLLHAHVQFLLLITDKLAVHVAEQHNAMEFAVCQLPLIIDKLAAIVEAQSNVMGLAVVLAVARQSRGTASCSQNSSLKIFSRLIMMN